MSCLSNIMSYHYFSGFKEQQKLNRHKVTHTGEKNHKCKYCGKGFGLKHNMKSHEKIHVGEGKRCRFCDKYFSQAYNLKFHEAQHVKKKHQVTDDPEVQKAQSLTAIRKGRPSIVELDRKKNEGKENSNKSDVDMEVETEESIQKFIDETAETENIKKIPEVNEKTESSPKKRSKVKQ